ncbi:MAG: hypothetical protein IPO92_08100 [Saprospiraceae bacterium]|nr:hypothetical protein [Saprospiraceae bacterium]
MLTKLLCVIISTFPLLSHAQYDRPFIPYKKITWQDLLPEWYETVYVAEMDTDSCDGYNYLSQILFRPEFILGDYIYSAYKLKIKSRTIPGTSLKRRR